MGIANKYNNGVKFESKAKEMVVYCSLKELGESERIYKLRALYINTKGKYGDNPVALVDNCGVLVNLPSHLLGTVNEMLRDNEFIEAVNKGAIGFKIYKYDGKNGSGFSVNWVDIQPQKTKQTDLPF